MTVPVAHAGHWLAGLLYLAPVFVLAGGIAWQRLNDRRHPERHRTRENGEN